jgi:hypothetical protein
LVYINDVIIFSRNLANHIYYVNRILDMLESLGITLLIAKCFFAYLSVQALGHKVLRLGLSIMEEKIQAVCGLLFPASL